MRVCECMCDSLCGAGGWWLVVGLIDVCLFDACHNTGGVGATYGK